MKINERYEIRLVVIEMRDSIPGNCYGDFEEFRKNHPYSSYTFGFIVYDTKLNCIPEKCNDWNDSPEEAMHDCEDNCI
jgi:hypothetical protein